MSSEQPDAPRVIAGFWRRLGASVLDALLLGILGLIVGSLFASDLVALGPWGRLLGFTIAVSYFGILNSGLAGGQTLGKYILDIRVVGGDGEPLSLFRSLLRFLPLGAVWFLNGAQFSDRVLSSSWMYVISVAVFGLGLSIVYLYVFNRRSRQSVHDLLVGSYVVTATHKGAVTTASVWRPHLVVCALLLLVSAVLPHFTLSFAKESLAELMQAYRAVIEEPGVIQANVSKGSTYAGDSETTFLSVSAYLYRPDVDSKVRAERLAALVLSAAPSASTVDIVQVRLMYGYDIGIASSWRVQMYAHPPAEWPR